MRRLTILFGEFVLIATRYKIAEIHLDLSGGKLIAIFGKDLQRPFTRQLCCLVLAEHRECDEFRDQRLSRLVFVAEP